MALKPTIYKFRINLSDLNRDYYDSFNLTVAQHPSEKLERMAVRVLAFCLNAEKNLLFTKGLSTVEEPDLWARSVDNRISLWIEVGEPESSRIKKAIRMAETVKVYSFNTKSDVWWRQGQARFRDLLASFFRFQWQDVQAFAALVNRTMELSVTVSGSAAYVAAAAGEIELSWQTLQQVASDSENPD